jgi:BASS family bile acid:Na+ symporter
MLGKLLSHHFWVPAYTALALGLWLPGDFDALRPLIPVALGGILYFSSLKMRISDLPAQLRGGGAVARVGAMTLLKLVVLPLIVFAVMRIIAPQWALGLFLVSMMPGGLSSAAMTDLYRGNLGLAMIVILFTSMLSPVTMPLLLQVCDPDGPRIEWLAAARQAGFVIAMLVSPFLLAQLTRQLAPKTVEKYWDRWGYCSIASVCVMIFVSVAANRHSWQDFAVADMAWPLALSCAVSFGFVLASMASHRVFKNDDAMAFGCNCIYMNNGLGVAFADRFFHDDPHMILPSILMQVPMVAGVLAYGRWAQRRSGRLNTGK